METKPAVPHRVERTRNRHSQATVTEDGILIRLAGGLSRAEEERHIAALLRRMAKGFARFQSKQSIDPFRPLLDGESWLELPLLTGDALNVQLMQAKRSSVRREGDLWRIALNGNVGRRQRHRLCWKILSAHCSDALATLVHAMNDETIDARIRSLKIRYTSSKWGSCSHRGDISLNPALLFTTPEILRYVIIHELAHTKEQNHSQRFWQIVDEAMPAYQQARQALRQYRLVKI